MPKPLYSLTHGGNPGVFSGYGIPLKDGEKSPLVGMLMVDRPSRCPPEYLDSIHDTFGDYQIGPMTSNGDRGLFAWLRIEDLLSLSLLKDDLYGPNTDQARYVLDLSCQNGSCRRVTVSNQKGVLYSEGVQLEPMLKIFGVKEIAACNDCGLNDHGVPERKSMFLMQSNGCR